MAFLAGSTSPSMPAQPQAIRRSRGKRWRQLGLGLALTSPWTIGFLWLTAAPMLLSLYESFTTYNLIMPPVWVGLENYWNLFADSLFITAFWNTMYLVAFMVPVNLLTALGYGLIMHQALRGQSIYRTLLYLPSLVPSVGGALLAIWMLSPRDGIINYLLSLAHLPGPLWFSDPNWAKPGLILLSLWGAGNAAVIFLAALKGVPRELYEQAMIDGATSRQQFVHITLPQISPVIFFNVVTATLGALQYFDAGLIIGGPGNSLLFMTIYLYRMGFGYLHMGYASAIAWVLLLISGILVGGLCVSQRWWVFYA
jgi:multiple sugar transport system permease protein